MSLRKYLLGVFLFAIAVSCSTSLPAEEFLEIQDYLAKERQERLDNFLFPEEVDILRPRSKERRTLVGLIRHKNRIVYDRSAPSFSSEQTFLLWSISKSITNLVMGVAEQSGILKMSQTIGEFFPNSTYPYKDELSLIDLLGWSSGLFFREEYEFAPLRSDVVAMLYTRGRNNMADYLLSRPAAAKPVLRYNYSTGDASLLMASLQKALNEKDARSFIKEKLFVPLGLSSPVWESDASGNLIGGASLYMSAKDLSLLGELVRAKGLWKGQRILPPDWMERSLEVVPSYHQSPSRLKAGFGNPAYHWWVNTEDRERGTQKAWPSAPEDTIVAQGHWGQLLVIIPSHELVAVRFADELHGATSIEDTISEVLKFVSDSKAENL